MLIVPALGVAIAAIVLVGKTSDDDPSARPTAATRPVSDALPARKARRAPVVVLLLDEFNIDQIRKPDGNIDAVRFPNFAKLARMSTWFPNAAPAFDETHWATPAVWDGMWPRRGAKPLLPDHPNNLFTWLGAKGYRIDYRDPASSLCPVRYCHQPIREKPKLYALLHKRRERLEAWIRGIKPSKGPRLWVIHEDLPHKPWVYLPSGRNDQLTDSEPVAGINSTKSFHDRYLTDHNHRRQLLQIGFVDRELGFLLRHLRRVGLLNKVAIAISADHGYAWELGVKDRRKITKSNIDEIATVPLFIKAPDQRKGAINRNYVRVIDIVPTLADVLNLKLNYRPDGRSAFGAAAKRRHVVRLRTRDFSRVVSIDAAEMQSRRSQNIQQIVRKFRTGADSVRLYGNPFESIYRFGPFPELIGRKLSDLKLGSAGSLRAKIANARLTRRHRRGSSLVHSHIAGRIDGGKPREKRVVAVAVNGTVRALGRSFYLLYESRETFSVLVPERWMLGRSRVRVFEVSKRGGSFVLTPMGSNS